MPVWVGVGVVTPLVARVVVGVVVVMVDDLVDVVEDCVEVMDDCVEVVEDLVEVVVNDCVEVVVDDCVEVAEDCVEVVDDWLDVVDVVKGTSSVAVPITQYSLLRSRPAQVIPGFNLMRSLTDNAQPSARLAQVVPLSTAVEK